MECLGRTCMDLLVEDAEEGALAGKPLEVEP